jgi:hypothetical protein
MTCEHACSSWPAVAGDHAHLHGRSWPLGSGYHLLHDSGILKANIFIVTMHGCRHGKSLPARRRVHAAARHSDTGISTVYLLLYYTHTSHRQGRAGQGPTAGKDSCQPFLSV